MNRRSLSKTVNQVIRNGGINLDKFRAMVAERAYCKAQKRGFAASNEMENWLEAEREVSNQCFHWFIEIQ